MKLRLPRFDLLDPEEQQPIFNAPLDTSMLVTGPPGTGKTVMAVYRLQRYLEARGSNARCKMLVYNRTLHQYILNGLRQHNIQAGAETFHSWFCTFFRRITGHNPSGHEFTYDWHAVMSAIAPHIAGHTKLTYIIDEGQDMPAEFYLFIRLISTHLMVFADENQAITGTNSTIGAIRNNAGFDGNDALPLTKNYRNTRQIAELAAKLFTGRPNERPALPDEARRGPKPRYDEMEQDDQYQEMINYCANNTRREIGIFVPTTAQARQVYRRFFADPRLRGRIEILFSGLTTRTCTHNNCGHLMWRNKKGELVCIYHAGHKAQAVGRLNPPAICQAEYAINILCYMSAKGVEFDTVFLPLLEPGRWTEYNDVNRMMFYVLTARPRTELRFLSTHPRGGIPVLAHIPAELFYRPKDEVNL